jgi:hypothetical protein
VARETDNDSDEQQSLAFWHWVQRLIPRRDHSPSEPDERQPRRGLEISVSVLVAVLLWFTFTMRETYTTTVHMPTVVQNVPEGEALAALPPVSVRVGVEGEAISLIRLYYNPQPIPIDASADVINLDEVVRDMPKNVRVTSVSPSVFNLVKEPVLTRTIPIRSRVEVRTPATHDLVEPPVLDPDSVRVAGAQSIVSQMEYWPTERRTLRDVKDSLSISIALIDTLQGLVRKSTSSTRVLALSERFTEGMREIDVNIIGGPERAVSLDPRTIRVRYRVLFSQYQDSIDAADFFATVSFDDILADTTGRVRPTLNLPSGIILRDVEMIPQVLRYFQRIE